MDKKSLKYVFFVIIMFFIFILSNKVSAATSTNYTIESYNINMVVNENNTFDITETITADFSIAQHGIYRKIPLRNSVTRADGTKSQNRVKITNIQVSDNYSVTNQKGMKVIKIGDSNKTVTGYHTYTIKYTYDMGKDPLKDADELYFNIIGKEWDTSISNVTFNVSMPKSFDESKLGFSSGKVGSMYSSDVEYTVDGNTINGYLIGSLNAGEALTIRMTLPEDYFVSSHSNIEAYPIIIMLFALICVLIGDRLWLKYGKDAKIVETVEFYPPEGYNSAEIGLLYEGVASTNSIISLLIYLANKGYLKIEETKGKNILSNSKGFKIIKLKDYDGDNEYERIFFKGLFKDSKVSMVNIDKAKEIMKEAEIQGEKISFQDALLMSEGDESNENIVTGDDLYNSFYMTLDRIRSKLNSKENKNKIFESASKRKSQMDNINDYSNIFINNIKTDVRIWRARNANFRTNIPSNRIYSNFFNFFWRT